MIERMIDAVKDWLGVGPVAISVINLSDNPNPAYETDGAAALDIRSNHADIVIPPRRKATISTGLFVAIPKGYKMKFAGRSGLAHKFSVEPHRGIIDSDFRGELKVIVYNHSNDYFTIQKGNRICQAYLQRVVKIRFKDVDYLPETQRGAGGLGSTGIK